MSSKPEPNSDNSAKLRPDGNASTRACDSDPEGPDQPPARLDMKFGAEHDILEASAKYTSGYSVATGWPAVESAGSSKPVCSKEQWQSVTVTPEIGTPRKLNDNQVKSSRYTRSHGLVKASWRVRTTDAKKETTIEELVQTGFTVAEVGTVLEKFSSPKGMMRAIYDAFQAHKEAYEKHRLPHRDIPILDDGSGILNDWDPVPDISQIGQAGRAGERTGTWPFMSIMLLENPYKTHTVRDDLESLFWVVLYYALLYLPHNITKARDEIVDKVFMDMYFPARDGRARGGVGKVALLNGAFIGFKADPSLEFTDCRPLSRFIKSVTTRLRGWDAKTNDILAAHHRNPPPTLEESICIWEGDPLQKLHADIEDLWKETLNAADWHDGDDSDDARIQINPPPQRAGNRVCAKHSREDEEDDNDPDIRVPPSKKTRSSRR